MSDCCLMPCPLAGFFIIAVRWFVLHVLYFLILLYLNKGWSPDALADHICFVAGLLYTPGRDAGGDGGRRYCACSAVKAVGPVALGGT